MRCEMALRFDFGLLPPRIRCHDDVLVAIAGPDLVAVRAPIALEQVTMGCWSRSSMLLPARNWHSSCRTVCRIAHRPMRSTPERQCKDTLAFWNDWAGQFRRETPWRDAVMRSLLTLKALSYHPTGGIVAAATTSLPEMPGGELNWDYRYCWLRDASFTLSALLNAGYHQEAASWRDWMLRAIAATPDKMRIMYRVDGSRRINEWEVGWLPGYEGAAPVRSGNDAAAPATDRRGRRIARCAGLDRARRDRADTGDFGHLVAN